jgi:hypothetical protein
MCGKNIHNGIWKKKTHKLKVLAIINYLKKTWQVFENITPENIHCKITERTVRPLENHGIISSLIYLNFYLSILSWYPPLAIYKFMTNYTGYKIYTAKTFGRNDVKFYIFSFSGNNLGFCSSTLFQSVFWVFRM